MNPINSKNTEIVSENLTSNSSFDLLIAAVIKTFVLINKHKMH